MQTPSPSALAPQMEKQITASHPPEALSFVTLLEDFPMAITVHHRPADNTIQWNIHVWQAAWNGNNIWDIKGTASGDLMDLNCQTWPILACSDSNFIPQYPPTGKSVGGRRFRPRLRRQTFDGENRSFDQIGQIKARSGPVGSTCVV